MATHILAHSLLGITDEDIMAQVGPVMWTRGLISFRAGRVLSATGLDSSTAEGRVQDAGLAYHTSVSLIDGHLDLSCACPIRQDCQHAVATVLVLRDTARLRVPPEHEWRSILTSLIGGTGVQGEPLALLVDTHDPSQDTWLQPQRQDHHGGWTTRHATWPDLTSTLKGNSLLKGLNPTHLALLREGFAISRENHNWVSGQDVTLESLGDRAVNWMWRAARAGIAMVISVDPWEPLILDDDPWHLDLDVTEHKGQVRVNAVASNGSDVLRAPRIIRSTGVMLLQGGTRAVRLEGDAGLLAAIPRAGMVVPAQDLPEFRRRWVPQIRRHFAMTSSNRSFDFEGTVDVAVVASVQPEGNAGVSVRWWAEYGDGEHTSRVPLETVTGDQNLDHIRGSIHVLAKGIKSWSGPTGFTSTMRFDRWRMPDFLDQVVSRIQLDQMHWDIDPQLEHVSVDQQGMSVHASLTDQGATDWFGLNVEIFLNGHAVPLADLLEAVARGEDHLLVDGSWVRIDADRLNRLQELLEHAATVCDAGEGRIGVLHAGLWHDIAEEADHVDVAEAWTKKVEAIISHGAHGGLPVSKDCLATLRSYQQEGHAWLTALAHMELGGILADDMGLGKTLQLLSAIQALKDHTEGLSQSQTDTSLNQTTALPVLVIAPTSVLSTWRREAKRFTPNLDVRVISQTSKRRLISLPAEVKGADVVITSYTIVRLDAEEWADLAFSGLVIDEAQAVKNSHTAIHQALEQIQARWRVAVTGTPVENSVSDLWSIMRLTTPGLLPGWKVFNEHYRKPIEAADQKALDDLHRLIVPFIMRRTKEQVATDLPDKTETVVDVELGEEHRRIYEQYLNHERSAILGLLEDQDHHRFEILAALTRLRLLALDPALVDENWNEVGSTKIEFLADQLDEIIPAGHRVLVFSQFTSFLKRIRDTLERRGLKPAYLDGGTRDRDKEIECFRSGETPVFLISLKAGGTGLTLTEADYVFVMDPWWNPAAEEQAIDRAHRIGQTHKVNVYRLAATDTIEQKVLELQERKRALVAAVVDGEAVGKGRLDAEDLRTLLEN